MGKLLLSMRYFIAALVLCFSIPFNAIALDVSVSATVAEPIPPDETATITFSGYAYPNSTVTLFKDSVSIGTTTADSSASFSITTTTDPGTYTFALRGRDTASTDGALLNVTLLVAPSASMAVSDMFLGPTITQSATSVTQGQSVTFSGYSVPNSTVAVTVNSPQTLHLTAVANSSGFWSETVSTGSLSTGNHTAFAQSTFGSLVSEVSSTLSFIVNGVVVNVCDGKLASDINCDGFVNLVDFSIMLFYWQVTNPANARADINADTIVNESDFSIMLFEWT